MQPIKAFITSRRWPSVPSGTSTSTCRCSASASSKTVNFDDPGTYHLYYGDLVASPCTIMTFFPWRFARRGGGATAKK
ncbi:MAG: hypothetical protein R3A10_05675 [Caldilineaceae bacterium]